jgi:hypothetical protein
MPAPPLRPLKTVRFIGLFDIGVATFKDATASREIGNCIGCDTEKLSFSGGSYFKPEIKFQIAPNVFVGLAYTLFCPKCDFKNMITLTFSGNFSEQ